MKEKIKILSGLVLGALLFSAGPAFSGIAFNSADGLASGLSFPVDVASSSSGKIYVADSVNNQVLAYDSGGRLTTKLKVNSPNAVAVGDNGTIYVATNEDLSVRMYNAAGVFFGVMGIGANEFKLPRNIDIDDNTGNVYVVDTLDNSIKVYTAIGAFLRRISDDASQPQDVAVTATGIYVADQPLLDGLYGKYPGSRVRVYDLNGNPAGSFGENELFNPRGITVDTSGIVYVSDVKNVSCFKLNGDYLGTIGAAGLPQTGAQGLDISSADRLYVAYPFADNEKVRSFVVKGIE